MIRQKLLYFILMNVEQKSHYLMKKSTAKGEQHAYDNDLIQILNKIAN